MVIAYTCNTTITTYTRPVQAGSITPPTVGTRCTLRTT